MNDTLDNYRLCEVGDCRWQVREPETRCQFHGGPSDNPTYFQTADGDIAAVHAFPAASECE